RVLGMVLGGFAHHLSRERPRISQISAMGPSPGFGGGITGGRGARPTCQSATRPGRAATKRQGSPQKQRFVAVVALWNGSCTRRRRMRPGARLLAAIALLLPLAGVVACAHTEYYPGTTILRN